MQTNMDNIIQYKVLKDNEELTKFQKDNHIGIVSISPFTQGVALNHDEQSVSGEIAIGVFVVYFNKTKRFSGT